MGKDEISIPLPTAATKKSTIWQIRFEERAKRALREARLGAARAMQNAIRVLRIIIFLPSAKDFPSVLRLYGIEESSSVE